MPWVVFSAVSVPCNVFVVFVTEAKNIWKQICHLDMTIMSYMEVLIKLCHLFMVLKKICLLIVCNITIELMVDHQILHITYLKVLSLISYGNFRSSFIHLKVLTSEIVNVAISSFHYSPIDQHNEPQVLKIISNTTFKIKQTACEMWNLIPS